MVSYRAKREGDMARFLSQAGAEPGFAALVRRLTFDEVWDGQQRIELGELEKEIHILSDDDIATNVPATFKISFEDLSLWNKPCPREAGEEVPVGVHVQLVVMMFSVFEEVEEIVVPETWREFWDFSLWPKVGG
ncbi:hypothetical protein P280DRAFT_505141 [Massarina eburnea CBS 473.64]|uniref:Uncharacterized protein n=1 Tax=Massarina eburnea CBS 473.64 TaxID=1395130 RepID=A0A6A6S922_9PLEO|nr:hypothetical protein P280DRAFT_505141 [Massarina eburnea CBS 473.64]